MGYRIGPSLAAFLLLSAALLLPAGNARSADSPAYVALGNSLAFGIGANNPAAEGYVGVTHFALSETAPYDESGLDIVNKSVPGATSTDLLEPDGQLDQAIEEIETRRAEKTDDTDVVQIISLDIGGNDLLELATPDSPCIRDTSADECRIALGTMLRTLRDNLTEAISRLSEAAPEAEIFVLDLYNPYSGTGDAREIIANIAVQQVNGEIGAAATNPELSNVNLVTIYDLFQGHGNDWIASDFIHPNNSGHIVMAEALLAAIEDRPVRIPDEVLVPGGTTGAPTDPATVDSADDDDNTLLTLLIAVPIAFAAGAFVAGTFFVARGRRA